MQNTKDLTIKFTNGSDTDMEQVVWRYYDYDSYDVRGSWFMVFKKDRMVGMYRLSDISCVEYK